MNKLFLAVLSLFLVFACSDSESNEAGLDCPAKNCADYAKVEDAQRDFETNPECRSDLDHDKDGIACEDYNYGNTTTNGCPNTSNCGCSNKTKANCESSACCKWIVGSGCKCKN